MFDYVLIGGTFDDKEGKKSGYIAKLAEHIKAMVGPPSIYLNGGNFNHLYSVFAKINKPSVFLWFPDIPNNKPKLIKQIKKDSPHTVLVSSKRNNNEYDFMFLVAHALKNRSNLLLSLSKKDGDIEGTLLDPLGNQFCKSFNIWEVATNIIIRIAQLLKFTRVESECISPTSMKVPDNIDLSFFDISKKHADIFHELIHGINKNRFLGNLSFRCECGFPSFRKNNIVFTSQRNIDKRYINPENFVAVKTDSIDKIKYYGINKPSVDTPIQLLLYRFYPNIKYMIHSHVYISGAPPTENVIPCGAIEEFYEIVKFYPYRECSDIAVNLIGHGSLVMSNKLAFIEDMQYTARKIPEIVV